MKSFVSIIVPVYNVENYLKRCVDSLLAQTLTNIEIILVDDGSTDNSSIIVDQYANVDNRIKVIHKINGGLSSARNAGIEIATGEYIGFVDSDDWVEHEMFEKLYTEAEAKDTDIVMCGYNTLSDGKISSKVKPFNDVGTYDKDAIIDTFLLDIVGLKSLYIPGRKNRAFATVWIHLYKAKIIRSNNILFVSEREILAEDDFFNLQVYLHAESICVIHYIGYNYETRVGSLSKCYRKNLWQRKKVLLSKMVEMMTQNKLYEKSRSRIKNQYLNMAIEAINNESIPRESTSFWDSINFIKEITYDKEVVNILSDYPTRQMSLYGKVIMFFIKHHLALLLYIGYGTVHKLRHV